MAQSNALDNYFVMHRAIKFDLNAMERVSQTLSTPQEADNLDRWFKFFWQMVEVHHTGEDEICFPMVERRVPRFGQDLIKLGDDHHKLDALVDEIGRILGNLKNSQSGEGFRVGQQVLYRTVKELNEHMVQHLAFEEGTFATSLLDNFSDKEVADMEKQLQKHTPMKLIALLLPWVLSGMDEAEREVALKGVPGFMRLLYKLSWKKKYDKLTVIFRQVPELAPELAHR